MLQSIGAVLLVSAVLSSVQWSLTYAFGPTSSIGAADFDVDKNEVCRSPQSISWFIIISHFVHVELE